jgi:hypothetical protein
VLSAILIEHDLELSRELGRDLSRYCILCLVIFLLNYNQDIIRLNKSVRDVFICHACSVVKCA